MNVYLSTTYVIILNWHETKSEPNILKYFWKARNSFFGFIFNGEANKSKKESKLIRRMGVGNEESAFSLKHCTNLNRHFISRFSQNFVRVNLRCFFAFNILSWILLLVRKCYRLIFIYAVGINTEWIRRIKLIILNTNRMSSYLINHC